MNRYLVVIWGVFLLLPLLPVVVLYAIFDTQNYFKLEDAAKGLLATGPIAAYFALVWLGWIIYKRFSDLGGVDVGPALKAVLGDWNFDAESKHGTTRSGHLSVENEHGVLRVCGTFVDESGKDVGNWDSSLALLSGKSLTFIYDLTDLRDSPQRSEGLTRVTLDDDGDQLAGTWVVVGVADAFGSIKCTKPEQRR